MTTQYWAEEAELYDVEQWARGRVMWENITSGQFGDCLVYLGLIPASRRSGSSAITCVSNGLTGGTGSRFIDGELGMF